MAQLCKPILSVTALLLLTTVASAGTSPHAAGSAERDPLALPLLTAMPAERQIQLALSAAPPEIAPHATVYVLKSRGYVNARTGTNGFTCLVERQYPETLEPLCYDPEGSATILPARLYREELRTAGLPEEEVQRKVDAAYKTGRFQAPRKPGLAYMLSTQARVYDPHLKKIIQAPPHLMFYAPYATNKDVGGFWGQHLPFVIGEGQPDAYIIVIPALMSVAPQR